MQEDKAIEKYKEIRRKYLARRIKGNTVLGHIPSIVENLTSKLWVNKIKAKEFMQKLPFSKKFYESLRDCRVLEISFESGTHGSHILKSFLREASRIYLVSPFLNANGVEHLYDLACNIDFKIIT